jgi:hypothetical protein
MIQDEIRFMRIRTKRHEIMISPGETLSLREASLGSFAARRQAISAGRVA